jgi:DNA-binding MarR family transcriptional regulator
MTDVKIMDAIPDQAVQDASTGGDEFRRAIELLFFGYRDFTAEPDRLLARLNFGRAHHRVIYFVGRHPGISVSELLAILRITKQSLARVLSQLIREGYVIQRAGTRDRRQRLLELAPSGLALEKRLTEAQSNRIRRAVGTAGPDAMDGFARMLLGLVDEPDRRRFDPPADPPPVA